MLQYKRQKTSTKSTSKLKPHISSPRYNITKSSPHHQTFSRHPTIHTSFRSFSEPLPRAQKRRLERMASGKLLPQQKLAVEQQQWAAKSKLPPPSMLLSIEEHDQLPENHPAHLRRIQQQELDDKTNGGKSKKGKSKKSKSKEQPKIQRPPLPVSVKQTLTVTIEDLSHEGHGIAKYDSFPIFIPNTLPGEEANIQVNEVKGTYALGVVNTLNSIAPYRTTPPCKFFETCGGCSLQHLTYDAQLAFKTKTVINALTRIGKLNLNQVTVHPIIGMDDPWRYRNKAQIPIGAVMKNNKENIRTGFFSARTHKVVDIDDCLILPKEIQPILTTLTEELNRIGVRPYTESKNYNAGVLRHIILRKSTYNDDLMVILVTRTDVLPEKELIIEKIREVLPNVKSIQQNINHIIGNTIMGKFNVPLWGEETILDSIEIETQTFKPLPLPADIPTVKIDAKNIDTSSTSPNDVINISNEVQQQQQSSLQEQPLQQQQSSQQKQPPQSLAIKQQLLFDISPHSFFQVNAKQTNILYQKALEFSGLLSSPPNTLTVLDAYCGVGTISLFFAPFAKRVHGIEVLPEAIQNATRNAIRNGLNLKTFFHCGQAEYVLPNLMATRQNFHIDIVVIDPPRKGCDKLFIETIVELKVKKVVYISCNPSTLARDLQIFEAAGYKTRQVQPVDQFPMTFHTEAVAELDYCPDVPKENEFIPIP